MTAKAAAADFAFAFVGVCVCVCVWPGGGGAAFGIVRFQVQALAKRKKNAACVVFLDKVLYSHCLSPPSCKNGYLASAGEAKHR